MKRLWFLLVFATSVTRLWAQIEILGFSNDLANGVRAAFPDGASQMESAIGKIPATVGNNGDARIDYLTPNGDFRGEGVSGTVSTFVNFGIGELITGSTKVGTEITWECELGPDGYVRIVATVTVHSLNGVVSRKVTIKTACTNTAAQNATSAPVVLSTGNAAPNRSSPAAFSQAGGRYELRSYPAQMGYLGNDGKYHVVAYTQYVWVWVPDDMNGQQQCEL